MDTTGEGKEDVQEKRGWNEYKQPWQQETQKLRTRSMEKQRGMAFGFRKTETAVKKTG